MSNQRLANFAYFAVCLTLFIVIGQLLTQVWGYFNLSDGIRLGRFGLPWILALVTTVPTFWYLRQDKANNFVLEVISELREVTWPTRQDTTKKTMVVIVTVVVVSLILGGFDVVWAKLSKMLLNPNL